MEEPGPAWAAAARPVALEFSNVDYRVSVRVGGRLVPDIAWSYPVALPEVQAITGLVSFYDGRPDAVYLAGELQPKPKGPLSG